MRNSSIPLPQLPLHLPKPHDERIQEAEYAGDPEAVPENVAGVRVRGERDLRAGKEVQLLVVVSRGQPDQESSRCNPRRDKTSQRFHEPFLFTA